MAEEDNPYRVNRCVCFETTFADLKAAGYSTLEEVKAKSRCSTKCGLCQIYIERMLLTGETDFPLQLPPFSG